VPENNKGLDESAAPEAAVLVYSTFPSLESAETAARFLVEQGLAACVNIIPGMTSIYRWQGAIHRDAETVMIIKTRRELADTVVEETRKRHPYTNPALVILGLEGGSADFLAWIADMTDGSNAAADD